MNIEGTYTLQTSPADVWRYLGDRALLLQVFPGLERLDQVEQNAYALTIQMKHAPLLGTYDGQVNITEKRAPYFCHFALDGTGKQSAFSGDAVLQLHTQEDMTILHYKGNIWLVKTDESSKPKLTKGAIKLLLQEFFNAVSERLREGQTCTSEDEVFVATSIMRPRAGTSVEQSIETEPAAPTWLRRLVHLSRLGKNDPAREELWVTRIRRIGIASGLLFLVWLGTRIPRR